MCTATPTVIREMTAAAVALNTCSVSRMNSPSFDGTDPLFWSLDRRCRRELLAIVEHGIKGKRTRRPTRSARTEAHERCHAGATAAGLPSAPGLFVRDTARPLDNSLSALSRRSVHRAFLAGSGRLFCARRPLCMRALGRSMSTNAPTLVGGRMAGFHALTRPAALAAAIVLVHGSPGPPLGFTLRNTTTL